MSGGACGTALPAQTDLFFVAPYSISVNETVPQGFKHYICYSCDIKPTGLPIITFTKDLIEISALALDCSGSLVDVVGFTNPAQIPYNSAGATIQVISTYTEIFSHT